MIKKYFYLKNQNWIKFKNENLFTGVLKDDHGDGAIGHTLGFESDVWRQVMASRSHTSSSVSTGGEPLPSFGRSTKKRTRFAGFISCRTRQCRCRQ